MKKLIVLTILLLTGVFSFSQVKDYKDIKFPEANAPKKVSPYKFKLKNGLTVLLLEDHELPIIGGRIMFHAGSVYDVAGKEGLAELTADILRTGGNKIKTGDEMDNFLESIAASVESFSGDTSATVSFNSLKENFNDVLPLFKATLVSPIFDEDKIKTSKAQMKASVIRRNDDPKGIAGREFSRLVYGKQSPLSSIVELSTIDAISKEDMAKYHKEFYNPTNAVLAVWGDFNKKEMEKTLTNLLKDWDKGTYHKADLKIKTENKGVYFVQREGITQSNIMFGHLGVERINPDYPAIVLFSRILGGGFDSRMMKTIRRDKGLSYSPHGGIRGNYQYPGMFQIAINTKFESTGQVLDIMKSIITDIQENGVTKEELEQSKDGFLNSYAFEFDSLDKQIGRALTYEFYNYPQDFNDNFFNGLKKVTIDDVKKVANKYVHLDNSILMVVCDEPKLDKPLKDYGNVTKLDVTIPKPEMKKDKVAQSEQSLKAGHAILAKAFAKIDPKNQMKNAESFKMVFDKDMVIQGNPMKIGMDLTIKYPDNLLLKVNQMGMDIIMKLTAEKSEMNAMGQSRPLPPAQIASMKKIFPESLPMMFKKLMEDDKCANLVKQENFNGKNGLFVTFTNGEKEETYIIDEEYNIIGNMSSDLDPRTGEQVNSTSIWGSYKNFNEIMFPEIIETKSDKASEKATYKNIQVNIKDIDSLFN